MTVPLAELWQRYLIAVGGRPELAQEHPLPDGAECPIELHPLRDAIREMVAGRWTLTGVTAGALAMFDDPEVRGRLADAATMYRQERADEDARALVAAISSPFHTRWHPLQDEWLTTEPPPRDWLLRQPGAKGFFPAGKVGMLVAGGGVGKTMALVQLALSVASGAPWLGHYHVPIAGKVLIALGEEDLAEVRRRIYNAASLMWPDAKARAAAIERLAGVVVALPLAGLPVGLVESDREGNVQESGALRQLRDKLHAEGPWRLIILDPLSRFAGADTEIDNAAATRFVQAVESLVEVPGNPAIMLAHHNTKAARRDDTKADATDARGASAITDGVRWVANLRNVQGDVHRFAELRHTKSNYGPTAPDIGLVRSDTGALRIPQTEVEQAAFDVASKPKPAGKESQKPPNGFGFQA